MHHDYTSKKTIGLVSTVVERFCAHIEDAISTRKSLVMSSLSIVDWSMDGVIFRVNMKIAVLSLTAVIPSSNTRANFTPSELLNTTTFGVQRKTVKLVFFDAVCSKTMRIFTTMFNENVFSVRTRVSAHKR